MNGDGEISHNELATMLYANGADLSSVYQLCAELGLRRKSDSVSCEKLLKHKVWHEKRGRLWLRALQDCRVAFDKADVNGDNYIDKDELARLIVLFTRTSEVDFWVSEFLRHAEVGTDAEHIDYAGFVRVLYNLREGGKLRHPAMKAVEASKLVSMTTWRTHTSQRDVKEKFEKLPPHVKFGLHLYRKHMEGVYSTSDDLTLQEDESDQLTRIQKLRMKKDDESGMHIPAFFRRHAMLLTMNERIRVVASMEVYGMMKENVPLNDAIYYMTWGCLEPDAKLPLAWHMYELENRRLSYRTASSAVAQFSMNNTSPAYAKKESPHNGNNGVDRLQAPVRSPSKRELRFTAEESTTELKLNKMLERIKKEGNILPPYIMSEVQHGMILSTKRRAVVLVFLASLVFSIALEAILVVMTAAIETAAQNESQRDFLANLLAGKEVSDVWQFALILMLVFLVAIVLQVIVLLKYSLYLSFLTPRFAGIHVWPIDGEEHDTEHFLASNLIRVALELPFDTLAAFGINPLRHATNFEVYLKQQLSKNYIKALGAIFKVLGRRVLVRVVAGFLIGFALIPIVVYINCRVCWRVVTRVAVFSLMPAYTVAMMDELLEIHFPSRIDESGLTVGTVRENKIVGECAIRAIAVVIAKKKYFHPSHELLLKHLATRFEFNHFEDFDAFRRLGYADIEETKPKKKIVARGAVSNREYEVLPLPAHPVELENEKYFISLFTNIAEKSHVRFVLQVLAFTIIADSEMRPNELLFFRKVCNARSIRSNLVGLKKANRRIRECRLDLHDILSIPTVITDDGEELESDYTLMSRLWLLINEIDSVVSGF